jgi:cytochrome c oxidase subunit IV
MAHSEHLSPEQAHKSAVKKIWTVAFILAAITALEFLLAFTMQAGTARNIIFILMTLLKAFYIVAEFMHLKGEVKVLILCIVLPIVFIIWLIAALLLEGGFMNTY